MTRQTVVLTGGTGLLAINWACALRAQCDIVLGTHTRHVRLTGTKSVRLDLEDAQALTGALQSLKPHIVVHAAGITSVEACERDPALAHHVYADLSRNVARAAARVGSRLIHVSTDHLFAGTRSMYAEDAPLEPVNAYARAKAAAEDAVGREHPDALIVRTNFFGWGHRYRRSFSDWIYCALTAGRSLTMFDDVFITPILADRVALHAHRLAHGGAYGVYNIVGDERISKYDFAARLAQRFRLPEALLQRGKISASQLSARRPRDMSLDNTKARQRLGTPLGNVAEHLVLLHEQDEAGRRAELAAAVTE